MSVVTPARGKAVKASKDCDIRAALRARLGRRYAGRDDVLVVEELPICRGTVRTDLAVVSNHIHGIEIKSAADTLDRLPTQATLFSAALDRVTLAAAPRHLEAAMALVPDWWAVLSAEMGTRGGIWFRRIRPGRVNPSRTVEAVAQLLERDELVGVLSRLGLDRGWRTKTAACLLQHVAETLTLEQATAGACRQLKVRAYIEQRHGNTTFGRTAFGGALASMARELR